MPLNLAIEFRGGGRVDDPPPLPEPTPSGSNGSLREEPPEPPPPWLTSALANGLELKAGAPEVGPCPSVATSFGAAGTKEMDPHTHAPQLEGSLSELQR